MRAGQFVELGPAAEVLTQPKDPYTKSLVAAVPEIPA
jgi:peptide/nickel transport system ATP-binding protein